MLTLKGCYFVTGTDTDIGKTYVTAKLLKAAGQQGQLVSGLKPIASGAENGINDDALQLLESSTVPLELKDVNPFCFEPAIAPHIAAKEVNQEIEMDDLIKQMRPVMDIKQDLCLIEGAGGWNVPINSNQMWRDLIQRLDISVIIVVGMRLGCLNHALLTERAIKEDGCVVHGWIANGMEKKMPNYQENLDTLKQHMQSTFLCEVR